MQQNKSCLKADHNLEYQYINWTDKKENLLQCSKCIIEDEQPIFQKILISDLLNESYKESQIQNWPPLQNKNQSKFVNSIFKCSEQNPSEQNLFNNLIQIQIDNLFKDQELKICSRLNQIKKDVKIKFETYIYEFYEQNKTNGKMNIEQIIKNLKIDEFRTKMKEFLDNKINIDQFFQFQQGKNDEFINKYGKQIDEQFTQQSEIQEQFQRLKEDIDNSLSIINKYEFFNNKKINLPFYKSNYTNVANSFQITPDNKKITFDIQNANSYKQVYSDILEKQRTYHIKIRIDSKGTIKNQYFYFGINTYQKKDQALYNINYISAFCPNNNITGSGQYALSPLDFKNLWWKTQFEAGLDHENNIDLSLSLIFREEFKKQIFQNPIQIIQQQCQMAIFGFSIEFCKN
ncbi:hypothetical protein PPERSA_00539 [Pseudocohnilembus persalinus]|uniref:Uncharacterized protein n=1 Tax=Pseudocohnilembus persalinus TaxID=266149 RepID=A0A0V0QIH8_PSEPJ|nr:hypothetical protein PPERSA_00539 [Pseudocohnilembus persalinus]|eukprot:KRX01829.1 hypothetical protein PPERSA_00539 [Pseudocohnilembus persalinus]